MTSHLINDFAKRTEEETGLFNPGNQDNSSGQASSRRVPASGSHIPKDTLPDCTFCRIISGEEHAHKIYEDEHVIAILDILPIRSGHSLVIPKKHIQRISDLPPELSGHIGQVVSKVAKALVESTGNGGLNVVCNQEYAQAVPHVHYHVVPAPLPNGPRPSLLPRTKTRYFMRKGIQDKESLHTSISTSSATTLGSDQDSHKAMLRSEYYAREELDDEDAERLVSGIRAKM